MLQILIKTKQIIFIFILLGMAGYSTAAGNSIRTLKNSLPAPLFELSDLDENKQKLKDYRGKIIAVNFWATWCPPCRKELPSMQRTYDTFKDKDFIILAINVGESWDTVVPFLGNFSLTFPILFDTESTIIKQWKVQGLPTTFILDKQGNITHKITGGRDWDDPVFRESLRKIIETK